MPQALILVARPPSGEYRATSPARGGGKKGCVMPGKSRAERASLERQNATIMAVFEGAGFDHIAPDIIQPADIFLERSGEDIRARTFVFTDPSGAEMCLRPDLTVPACRYYLSHGEAEARYAYCGPAFRFPDEHLSPQEFTQAGLEWFAATDSVAAEARILKLTIAALEAAGLTRFRVTLGDLGLFAGLLEDTAMPQRWRRRLQHHFWRPSAFRELLDEFCSEPGQCGDEMALLNVAAELVRRGLPLVGGRDVDEISARLQEKAADEHEPALSPGSAEALFNYLAIADVADAVPSRLAGIAAAKNFAIASETYARRIFEMEEQGLNPRRFHYSATFGRELEYYTGFTFQIEAETPHGLVPVAGGGRYDNLLFDMGAPAKIPACGCAIHTDRLLAVLA